MVSRTVLTTARPVSPTVRSVDDEDVNAEQALLQERGQGNVKIRSRTAGGNRIAREVSDDGPGIPREIASRISIRSSPPSLPASARGARAIG